MRNCLKYYKVKVLIIDINKEQTVYVQALNTQDASALAEAHVALESGRMYLKTINVRRDRCYG